MKCEKIKCAKLKCEKWKRDKDPDRQDADYQEPHLQLAIVSFSNLVFRMGVSKRVGGIGRRPLNIHIVGLEKCHINAGTISIIKVSLYTYAFKNQSHSYHATMRVP